jgi:signal transduction histidine kinase/GAF domain-containing protein/CheY-like chemotaxis protein
LTLRSLRVTLPSLRAHLLTERPPAFVTCPDFLSGGGQMGALIRAYDWSRTPLGAPQDWPQPLRTALRILLTTNHPIFLFWGSQLTCFYNDGYRQSLGPEKHPAMLGGCGREWWDEIWHIIGPQVELVMAGQGATWNEDHLVPITRHGRREDVYWTYSYGPIDDETALNSVGGVLVIVTETTRKVLTERRLAFQLALSDRLRKLHDSAAIALASAEMLGRQLGAARAGYGEIDDVRGIGVVERDWTTGGCVSLAGRHRLDDFGPPLMEELRNGRTVRLVDALNDPLTAGEVYASTYERIGARAGITVPLIKNDRFVAVFYLHSVEPRYWTDYEASLVLETAERTWDAIERARAETTLRESEARWRGLFEQAPSFMAMLNGPEHVFVYANAGYRTLVGQRGIVGKSVRNALPELAGQGYLKLLDHVYASGEAHIGRASAVMLMGAGGVNEEHFLDFVYQPITDATGVITGIFVEGHDVTHRVRGEVALRRSDEELRALNATLEQRVAGALAERKLWADIFENSETLIAALDLQFRYLAVNKAYADEFEHNYGVRVHAGDSLVGLLESRPDQLAASKARWGRALAGAEFTLVEDLGGPDRRKPYELRYTLLRARDGSVIGALQFAHDVSERVRDQARLAEAEESLRQSQKMEAVGQLTGGIAHDFNNLLTGIIGSLDMMQRRSAQGRPVDVQGYASAAMTAANRAAALTHRLLAFSRRQSLDPKPVNANRLVTGMEDMLRRTIGEAIQLEIVTAGGLWLTRCDPNQLENAVLNLAINARDAMPEGGKLIIETTNAHLDAAYAARSREIIPGQYVCICVTDTGTGMSPEVVAKAFDPFFTTKPIGQGTGLGLSMIYGFARQSEGYAKIYSETGKGTTMKLYLPRFYGEGESAGDLNGELNEDHRAGDGEVVLVVEDELVVRNLVVDVLTELDYRALEAIDGPSGLRILQSDARIDLLVTDVGLPGLNGRQLADAARVQRPDLKVLFITGYAHNAAVGNGSLEPGMQMITKPFAIETLASRIRQMIEIR